MSHATTAGVLVAAHTGNSFFPESWATKKHGSENEPIIRQCLSSALLSAADALLIPRFQTPGAPVGDSFSDQVRRDDPQERTIVSESSVHNSTRAMDSSSTANNKMYRTANVPTRSRVVATAAWQSLMQSGAFVYMEPRDIAAAMGVCVLILASDPWSFVLCRTNAPHYIANATTLMIRRAREARCVLGIMRMVSGTKTMELRRSVLREYIPRMVADRSCAPCTRPSDAENEYTDAFKAELFAHTSVIEFEVDGVKLKLGKSCSRVENQIRFYALIGTTTADGQYDKTVWKREDAFYDNQEANYPILDCQKTRQMQGKYNLMCSLIAAYHTIGECCYCKKRKCILKGVKHCMRCILAPLAEGRF